MTEPRANYGTQVAMGTCVFKPQPEVAILGAIGAALLSSAVTQGVNYLGKAIEESAKETNDRVTAVRNVEVTSTTFGPCLQLVRGWFFQGFSNSAESNKVLSAAQTTWAKAGQGQVLDEGRLLQLWQRRMWVAAQPDFVFEAEIVPSSAGESSQGSLTLSPVYGRLDAPISQTILRSKTREVVVFFAFADAGSDPSISDKAGAGIVLGRLKPGEDHQFPPPASDTTNQPNRGPLESKWFKVAVSATKKPMTVAALVTEHQDAQPFLQFIADVFNGAKTGTTTALQTALVPSLREAAEEAEQSVGEKSRSTYEGAFAAVLAAADTCAAGVSNAVATAADIRTKVRTLNAASRATGQDEFSEGMVPLSTDASAVRSGCAMLATSLRANIQS